MQHNEGPLRRRRRKGKKEAVSQTSWYTADSLPLALKETWLERCTWRYLRRQTFQDIDPENTARLAHGSYRASGGAAFQIGQVLSTVLCSLGYLGFVEWNYNGVNVSAVGSSFIFRHSVIECWVKVCEWVCNNVCNDGVFTPEANNSSPGQRSAASALVTVSSLSMVSVAHRTWFWVWLKWRLSLRPKAH